MKTQNMYINFKLNIDQNHDKQTILNNTINKPIMINNTPVGVITDVRLDHTVSAYDCTGIVWNKYIDVESYYNYCDEVWQIANIIVKG